MGRKIAVVLFNLGGPDGPDSVQPFLRNLFADPAIIQAPAPVRWALSRFISKTRAPSARKGDQLTALFSEGHLTHSPTASWKRS